VQLLKGVDHGASRHAVPSCEVARRGETHSALEASVENGRANFLIEPLPQRRIGVGVCERKINDWACL
jgi:hypothetical protein